ncbi:MAG: response regulator [Chitinophagia bacterium]|nr:response regulator [Chitinophagia bacterium]
MRSQYTILVIDDEIDLLESLSLLLGIYGYTIIKAMNATTGLDALMQHKVDLILCDVSMPDKSGLDLLIEIKNIPALKPIPFYFLTAMADNDDAAAGLAAGADRYITKPFSSKQLLADIMAVLP